MCVQVTEADLARSGRDADAAQRAWAGQMRSVCVLRENTLENARRLGYLDARQLYPDIRACMLEELAGRFYRLKEPGDMWM